MDLTPQIRAALTAQSLPAPSQAWLQGLVASRTPPPPLNSLVATARARLLALDLMTPGLLDAAAAAASSFSAAGGGGGGGGGLVGPAGAGVKEARLARDVVVQVLDIENLVRSRWEQIEELEAVERGEQRRGREIVRLPLGGEEGEDDEAEQAAGGGGGGRGGTVGAGAPLPGKNATHRLLVQDCKGQKAFALELKRIDQLAVGKTHIGEKMVIRSGSVVARGVILLEPSNCKFLGGKVDGWHKAWTEGRLSRLREAVGANAR